MSANVRVRASAGTAVRRRSTDATRTFGSKPKSAPRFLKVRPKSTAPTTSTIERATWPTTRPRRTATASCPSVDDRPPGSSVVAGSRRVAVSAGPRPNSMQATKADATMNANRRQSGVRSTKTGAGPTFRTLTSVWLIHRASSSPPAAPRPATSALSDRSWRTTRPRDAPIARRTAISRPRTVARASIRFARLTDVRRSTNPVAPSSTHSCVAYALRRFDTPVAAASAVSVNEV